MSGKGQGDPDFIAQLEWAGAPKEVIDKYLKRQEFELFDANLPAWEAVLCTGPGDYHYREVQKGKKVYNQFGGFRTTAIQAVLSLLKNKDTAATLRKIRLIEYGALTDGS